MAEKQYLNLQEQVAKNKLDIEELMRTEFEVARTGARIVGKVASAEDLPDPQSYTGDLGNAYLVGDTNNMYVLVSPNTDLGEIHNKWLDTGVFPRPGATGATGPIGPTGLTGASSKWRIGAGAPSVLPTDINGDMYLNTANSYVYQFDGTAWQSILSIKGAQGLPGPTGPTGLTGPAGPTGPQGPIGLTGQPFDLIGELNSTAELPDPSQVDRNSAYIVDVSGTKHLYVIVPDSDDELQWSDMGAFTAIPGPQGPTGPQGNPGVGVPSGGATGQYLKKASSTDYDFVWGTVDAPPRPNLLINPDFTINQRISSVYSSGGAPRTYTVDRWKIPGGTSGVNFTVASRLILSMRTQDMLEQQLVPEMVTKLIGKTITFSTSVGSVPTSEGNSFRMYIDDGVNRSYAVIHEGTNTLTHTVDALATKITVGYNCESIPEDVTSSGFILNWAKLEVGANATEFEIPDYTTEIDKCRWFYKKSTFKNLPFYKCDIVTGSSGSITQNISVQIHNVRSPYNGVVNANYQIFTALTDGTTNYSTGSVALSFSYDSTAKTVTATGTKTQYESEEDKDFAKDGSYIVSLTVVVDSDI